MKEKCAKCKKETEYRTGVSVGRRTHECLVCGTITFEDPTPGGVNTTETYFNSPTV